MIQIHKPKKNRTIPYSSLSTSSTESSLLPCKWFDLPLDILELISDHLNDDSSDTIDLLCLRSVCATWRLSLPLSNNKHKNNHLFKFPKHLPFWSFSSSSCFFILKQSNVYKLEALHKTFNLTSLLVKLQEISPGKMQVLDLFSNDIVCFLPENFPANVDLQTFHVILVRRVYRMEYENNGGSEISCFWSLKSEKVVIFSSGEDSALMAIHSGGKLRYLKHGNDERWRILDHSWNFIYEDIMVYGENCIVVDDKGKTVIYDVDFNVSEFAEGLIGGGGHENHLVEYSGGEVLLVEKYVKHVWCKSEFSKSAVEFRVYKLKKEEKRWEEVRELGDVAFFIGDECSFSVQIPTGGLAGGFIFYKDYRNGGRSRGVCSDSDGVFNVQYEIQGSNFVFPMKPKFMGP